MHHIQLLQKWDSVIDEMLFVTVMLVELRRIKVERIRG